MLELIVKDIYLCRKNLMTMSAAIILFFLLSETFLSKYGGKYDYVFFILWFFLNYSFIDNMFIRDEKNNSIRYILSMPVSRDRIVLSKYVLIFLVTLSCAVLSVFTIFADSMLRNRNFYEGISEGKANPILFFIAVTLIVISVYLPLFYRFGYEKASSVSLVSFLILFAIIMGTVFVLYLKDRSLLDRAVGWLTGLASMKKVFITALAFYFASGVLSMALFKRRSC